MSKLSIALAAAVFLVGSGYTIAEMTGTAAATGGNLCEDYPRFCVPCGGAGLPPCPTPAAGEWLCCNPATNVCAVANGSCPAPNIFGYCENYTENANGSVTCHDSAG